MTNILGLCVVTSVRWSIHLSRCESVCWMEFMRAGSPSVTNTDKPAEFWVVTAHVLAALSGQRVARGSFLLIGQVCCDKAVLISRVFWQMLNKHGSSLWDCFTSSLLAQQYIVQCYNFPQLWWVFWWIIHLFLTHRAHQCHQCLDWIGLYCPILVFRVLNLTNATRDCYRPFRRQLQ